MNEIQIFNYNNIEVRTVQKDGEPWFVTIFRNNSA